MAADTQSHRDICNDAVIAATCLGGQPSAARTMIGLRDNGPVAVTHIVPQCSLHSMASAACWLWHACFFGVGGGPHATAEFSTGPRLPRCWQASPSARIWLIASLGSQPSGDAKESSRTIPFVEE